MPPYTLLRNNAHALSMIHIAYFPIFHLYFHKIYNLSYFSQILCIPLFPPNLRFPIYLRFWLPLF